MNQDQTRVLKLRQLIAVIGYCRASIYAKNNPKSPQYDETLPRPIKLGSGRAVGWVAAEVEAWLQSRIAARDANAVPGKSGIAQHANPTPEKRIASQPPRHPDSTLAPKAGCA